MTSGSVTVTGPPLRIWARNSGTTLPAESSTLPKRTVTKRVPSEPVIDWQTISARRFVAPSTLTGSTALSVEIRTKVPTPAWRASRATVAVASTLLRTASRSCDSSTGTCL